MVLQSSGAISLNDVQTEFGGSNPISISEYYGVASGVPTSGTISLSNFYGKSAPRIVFGGGQSNPAGTIQNIMEYITATTTGNTTDFGDLSFVRLDNGSCSSTTRGVYGGGSSTPQNPLQGGYVNNMEYITIATTGNSTDFGDLALYQVVLGGCASPTRGIFQGGYTPTPTAIYVNNIQYITTATTGNATDFGDILYGGNVTIGGCGSPTRGIFMGGSNPLTAPAGVNNINYITIATTGNSTDFGDLTANRVSCDGASSSTRAIIYNTAGGTPAMEYVTIATTGNSTSFGSLSAIRNYTGAASSVDRAFAGGGPASNIIDYVTIATIGNATDFGDLSTGRIRPASCSSYHGGLV